MLNFRHAFTFALSTIGLAAILISGASPAIAHAPVKLPLPVHLARTPIGTFHAALEAALRALFQNSHSSFIASFERSG